EQHLVLAVLTPSHTVEQGTCVIACGGLPLHLVLGALRSFDVERGQRGEEACTFPQFVLAEGGDPPGVGERRSDPGSRAGPVFLPPCPGPWARCPTADRGPFRLVREGGGVFLGPVPKRCFSCREVTVARPGRRVGGVLHHRGQMYGV